MSSYFIRIFGERNTGTQAMRAYLQQLPHVRLTAGPTAHAAKYQHDPLYPLILERFSGACQVEFIAALRDQYADSNCPTTLFKHTAPKWSNAFLAHEAHVIFMIRNPYSWILSMYRRPYLQKGPVPQDFASFIDQPWLCERRENCDLVLRSPMMLWSQKLRAYRRFMEMAENFGLPVAAVRLESLVADGVGAVRSALNDLNIPATNLCPITEDTKDNQSFQPKAKAILAQSWREELSAELIKTLNQYIDPDLAQAFGYELLSPSRFDKQPADELPS